MVWILINTLNKNSSQLINEYCKRNPEKLIAKLHYKVLILKNDGEVLAYLVKLKKRFGDWVELYVIQPLELFAIPEKIVRVGEYMANHKLGVTTEYAIRHIPEIEDLEELKKCQIKFERKRDIE